MADVSEKQRRFAELMEHDHVLLHLDARHKGVEVPPNLRENATLVLKLSYAFQGEISFDEQAISAYLKFQGDYFHCVIPWTSIWGLTGSEGTQLIWPEDLPSELIMELAKQQLSSLFAKSEENKGGEKKRGKSSPPNLAQEEEKNVAAVDEVLTKNPKTKKSHPSHLRVVK